MCERRPSVTHDEPKLTVGEGNTCAAPFYEISLFIATMVEQGRQ